MLEELQNKIKEVVEKMQEKLVAFIKEFLKEEFVSANIAEDLSVISVAIQKNKEEEGRYIQNEFIFTVGVNDKGELYKNFTTNASAILLQRGKVIGSYALPVTTDLETISSVLAEIENFRNQELAAQKEIAAPTE
jgi:hypothetical protein